MRIGESAPLSLKVSALGVICLLAAGMTVGLLLCLGTPSFSAARHSVQHPSAVSYLEPAPGLRRLTDDGRSTPWVWTQDGRTLLIKRPGRMIGWQQLSELWAISVADASARRVSENAFSPSVYGTQVAYLHFVEGERWEAIVTDLSGEGSVQLGEARWNLPPIWVGDAAFYLRRSGQLATSTGLVAPRLPSLPPTAGMRARLSHDGSYLAATDGRQLWTWSEDGQVTLARADQIWGFAWSPEKAQLAYVRSDGGPIPELWVWDALAERSWILARGELEHFGRPVWSPDGRTLAFARHPTGNGPNASGDIWLVSADGGDLRPLARTDADEHSPCWSPDGGTLAFSLNDDVWLADLQAPDLDAAMAAASAESWPAAIELSSLEESSGDVQVIPLSLSAPLTIRVKHDGAKNTCRVRPDGQVDEYEFEAYLKRVVPYEVPASWPTETLKTQAVAARTYAWRRVIDMRAQDPDPGYDVWDSTSDQYMCDDPHPNTDAAVDETMGQYVRHGEDKPIYAFFCAEAGSPTHYQNKLHLSTVPLYLRPVDDPVSFGKARKGHSVGLSQWGAYRWAAWHGWDYQQILCHYYTSAAVAGSKSVTQPLAGLTLPWSDFYVNTDRAYLRANATDDTEVLTVTFAAQIADTWTTVHTDTTGSDGWQTVWSISDYSDTLTPSIGLQATVYDGAGQVTESGVSRVGLDRMPPTGTLSISSTEVNTLAVSLDLTVSDPSSGGAAVGVSLRNEDWVWEDTALYRFPVDAGEIVPDGAAEDGSAWHIAADETGVLYGPYTTILPVGRSYRAYFRLRVPTEAVTSSLELAKLDVVLDAGETLLGVRYVRGTDFKAGDAYQEFAVDFKYPESGGELELRTDFYGSFDMWVDRVTVVSYPIDLPAGTGWIGWTLPAREGIVTTTAKFVDRAENVSPDVTLAVAVTDDEPPGGWRGFQCAGATCTVLVRDVIAGLDVHSAAYRFATEGGTWGDWLPATCTGVDGSHDWETIAISEPDAPMVQFRIYDVAAVPNEGQSPEYGKWSVYLPVVLRNR